ncbi:MAG: peptidylprolyl isomerase [Fuerstiella sp.]
MKVQSFLAVAMLALLPTTGAASSADQAPDKFRVKFETSAGDFVLEVVRKWAPKGADRFYELVQKDFYKDARFFRVVPNFVVQWGINGDPEVQAKWREAKIADDPVVASNLRGYITFATAGPGTRTTQLFINLVDNQRLDEMGFAPFGRVVEGMEVVDKITAEYGGAPSQDAIQAQGNAYLKENFPNMDYIKSVKVVK